MREVYNKYRPSKANYPSDLKQRLDIKHLLPLHSSWPLNVQYLKEGLYTNAHQ